MNNSHLAENLRKKGWSEEEIEHTVTLFEKNNQSSTVFSPNLSKVVYWSGIIIGIFGNFIISAIMIPFLVFLDPFLVYFILGIIGIIFGTLFNVILTELEYLDFKHHIIANVFIPVIAIINVLVMVNLVNHLYSILFRSSDEILSTLHLHSAGWMAFCYVGFFLIPMGASYIKRNFFKK